MVIRIGLTWVVPADGYSIGFWDWLIINLYTLSSSNVGVLMKMGALVGTNLLMWMGFNLFMIRFIRLFTITGK